MAIKNKQLVLRMVLLLVVTIANTQQMKQELSLLDFEPRGQDPQILWDSEYNYTPEKYEQAKKMRAESGVFLENLSYTATKELKSLLEGNWILKDKSGKSIKNYTLLTPPDFFELKVDRAGNLFYRSQIYESYVYYHENNFYIEPMWYYGIMFKMVIVENKGYFYILENDEWKLSASHEGGKNAFVKYPLESGKLP